MTDYKVLLSYLSEHTLSTSLFSTLSLISLFINASSQDITPALQELGHVITAKQMTIRLPSPCASVTTVSLLLFLVTLTRCWKSHQIFTHTDLHSVVMKNETYKTQADLTKVQTVRPHLGPLQAAPKMSLVQGWPSPPRVSRKEW